MDTNRQNFTPERVDEQVDELLAQQSSVSLDEHFIHDLQGMYQADERSLSNVWQRLGLETAEEQPETLATEPAQSPASARVRDLARHRHARPRRPFVRTLSLIAAACIATLLIGSLLWITNQVRQASSPNSHPNGQQRTSASLPQGVYVSNQNGLFRLNGQTHRVYWQVPLQGIIKIVPSANAVYILQSALNSSVNAVVALDANTGKTLWIHPFVVQQNTIGRTTDLGVDQNRLYVGWQTWSSTSDNIMTGYVYVLNASNGSQQAVYPTTTITEGLAVGDGILAVSADSGLQVYNPTSGKPLWHTSINGVSNGAIIQVSIINNLVYALFSTNNEAGGESQAYIAAYRANSGALVWKSPVFPGDALLRFTVQQNILYFGTLNSDFQQQGWTGSVYAYNVQSNKLLWSQPVNGAVQSTPVISNGLVYVGADNDSNGHGRIIALSAANGAIKWQQPLAHGSADTFCVGNGIVYAINPGYPTKSTTPDGLYALNAANGSTLWDDTQFSSSPSSDTYDIVPTA